MSVLSQLVRLALVLAVVLCVVSAQGSSSVSSASSSSSSSGSSPSSSMVPIVSSSSSSPSSSSMSTAQPASSTGTAATSSMMHTSSIMHNASSSTGTSAATSAPHVTVPTPVLYSLSGCNSSMAAGSPNVSTCDGQSGVSVITIMGANFTASVDNNQLSVRVMCGSNSYTLTVKNVSSTVVMANTPAIDKMDANTACMLSVNNPDGQKSNSLAITFTSWATDIAEVFKFLGMGFTALIAVVVVLVIVLIIAVLCTLSCCCGVSLACLNVCCPRRSQPTVVLSPQSSGYASMA